MNVFVKYWGLVTRRQGASIQVLNKCDLPASGSVIAKIAPKRSATATRAAVLMMVSSLLSACTGGDDETPPSSAESVVEVLDLDGGLPEQEMDDSLDEDTLAELEALGYLGGYEEIPDKIGTVTYDPERAMDGNNLYITGQAQEAYLADMKSKILHTWAYDADQLYPVRSTRNYWRRVHLMPNGDLYALVDPHGIIKLNRNSELLWHTDGKDLTHHDFFVDDAGYVYALGKRIGPLEEIHPSKRIIDDTIVVFDDTGRRVRRFSLYDAFRNTQWFDAITEKMAAYVASKDGDPVENFHTNTIEVFDGSLAGISPFLKKGNIVLSSALHECVFIVDGETERVVWNWFGPWKTGIHQPTFLPNGNWLLFDNTMYFNARDDAASQVFEYHFPDMAPIWRYKGDPSNGNFYSGTSSLADRLENGNTLIVVSEQGRAIEVTPDKEVVWEFYNPKHTGENGDLIATLFQLERHPKERHAHWLESPSLP